MRSRSIRALSAVGASVLATGVLAGAAEAATPTPTPTKPIVSILGFTTAPRVAGVTPQARPGRTITQCTEGYNGQREINFVWRGKGIKARSKVGLALWGPPGNRLFANQPKLADVVKTASKWGHSPKSVITSAYGITAAGGPFGPINIDGKWTAMVVVDGKVLARAFATVACR